MGDRALVVFTDGSTVSPAVYLRWHGEEAPDLIASAEEIMASRPCDPEYAAARFASVCAATIDGNTGLGLQSIDGALEGAVRDLVGSGLSGHAKVRADRALQEGAIEVALGAGFLVVDVRATDWAWRAFGGYLEEDARSGFRVEVAA